MIGFFEKNIFQPDFFYYSISPFSVMYPDDRGCKRFLKCIFNKTLKEQTCANANEVFDESIDPKKCVDKAIASKESFCTMNTNL